MKRKSKDSKPKPGSIDELKILLQEAQDAMELADLGAAILEEIKGRVQVDDGAADTPTSEWSDILASLHARNQAKHNGR